LLVIALAPFVLIDGPAVGWLRDLGLLDRDGQFTELSFPDRVALPTSVTVGSPISFDIALHNREGEATNYRWKAVVTSRATGTAESTVELARGRVRLDSSEDRRILVVGIAPEPPGPATVRVSLAARNQAIDFRVAIVAVADGAPASTG
jgi:hypothetical protein